MQSPGRKCPRASAAMRPTCSNMISLGQVLPLQSGWQMAPVTGMTCWILSGHAVVGPQVTLIELHKEERGSRCHRRYRPEAGMKEHSLGHGGTG